MEHRSRRLWPSVGRMSFSIFRRFSASGLGRAHALSVIVPFGEECSQRSRSATLLPESHPGPQRGAELPRSGCGPLDCAGHRASPTRE